jgi:mRNA-degrading endonuclease RelE of RelBE toxin-antitoxin system
MSFSIELSPAFKKEAKRLSKKYPSLKSELSTLFKELEDKPKQGIPLGNEVYKIRIAIASKGKGKSGGARVISFVQVVGQTVYLLAIYSKGERDSISDAEIKELLKEYL